MRLVSALISAGAYALTTTPAAAAEPAKVTMMAGTHPAAPPAPDAPIWRRVALIPWPWPRLEREPPAEAPSPPPAPAAIELAALLDLAIVMREGWEDGALKPDAPALLSAALARAFPEYVHTVERCPCEPESEREPGEPKCSECATDAQVAALDAQLSAFLAEFDRPAVNIRIGSLAEARLLRDLARIAVLEHELEYVLTGFLPAEAAR